MAGNERLQHKNFRDIPPAEALGRTETQVKINLISNFFGSRLQGDLKRYCAS